MTNQIRTLAAAGLLVVGLAACQPTPEPASFSPESCTVVDLAEMENSSGVIYNGNGGGQTETPVGWQLDYPSGVAYNDARCFWPR